MRDRCTWSGSTVPRSKVPSSLIRAVASKGDPPAYFALSRVQCHCAGQTSNYDGDESVDVGTGEFSCYLCGERVAETRPDQMLEQRSKEVVEGGLTLGIYLGIDEPTEIAAPLEDLQSPQ